MTAARLTNDGQIHRIRDNEVIYIAFNRGDGNLTGVLCTVSLLQRHELHSTYRETECQDHCRAHCDPTGADQLFPSFIPCKPNTHILHFLENHSTDQIDVIADIGHLATLNLNLQGPSLDYKGGRGERESTSHTEQTLDESYW